MKKCSCRCIARINKKLAEYGAELDLLFNVRGAVSLHIATVRLRPETRKRPPRVIPSYCPFCGRAYKFKE